jgi:NNP family nitrate/nitrite transporter-like MFS transporter
VGNLAPGIFAFLLSGLALPRLGLAGSYLAWLALLVVGTIAYSLLGADAWYFQLRRRGLPPAEAATQAKGLGQELLPRGRVSDSLRASAAVWQTWALVLVYFTTFGGFMALTAWLPKYWQSLHGLDLAAAGSLTAGFSILASLVRIVGGRLADRLGGERASALGLTLILIGAAVAAASLRLPGALGGILGMAVGMGLGNAAVFKLVPQAVPHAVGGAAGWIGGLGAFGGFVIPNLLAAFVSGDSVAHPGYARGYLVLVLLSLLSLAMVAVLRRAARRVRA